MGVRGTGARNVGWHPDLSGLFAEASHDDVLPMMEIKAYYTLSDTRASNCGNLWLAAGSFKRKRSELTDLACLIMIPIGNAAAKSPSPKPQSA